MARIVSFLLLFLLAGAAPAADTGDLLEPEKAFRMSARALDARTVEVSFAIAEGYYMYRERFRFAADPAPTAKLGSRPGRARGTSSSAKSRPTASRS